MALRDLPELIERRDALLWSINERLAGNPGLDIEPLTPAWLTDAFEALDAITPESPRTPIYED